MFTIAGGIVLAVLILVAWRYLLVLAWIAGIPIACSFGAMALGLSLPEIIIAGVAGLGLSVMSAALWAESRI